MKVAAVSIAVALAGGSSVKLPETFPLSIAGFEFGDSFVAVRDKCEKRGKLKGQSRFRLVEDGAFCSGVTPSKPYLPWNIELGFTFKDAKLTMMFVPMPLEEVAKYARAIVQQVGEEGKTEKDGIYCAQYKDGTGSVCANLTERFVAFLANF